MSTLEKIREIMIPLSSAAIAKVDTRLKEAIPTLRRLYCHVEEGKCTEAGFRAILVLDEKHRLVGILDFQSTIGLLFPEISGNFAEKAHALWDSLGAVSRFGPVDETKLSLNTRIAKNAEKPIGHFMLKIRGTISTDADLLEALMVLCRNKASVLPVYDGDQLVGIVRDSDLFMRIAEMLEKQATALREICPLPDAGTLPMRY
ncbi:MAG TPA: CBS domain-containing protein [Desulfomonilaceae bacterium]|nr:CBS domain-containing protein [Desulfomonilaceae bacterium]